MLAMPKCAMPKTQKCLKPHISRGFRHNSAFPHCIKDGVKIEPPYNTGGDFVYKDDFRDNIENYKRVTGQVDGEGHKIDTNTESNGRFHTDWLNMMYPRLRLARNLLSDDGVIFISIDDNEQENLKKICDEVFGADNYINNISLKTKASAGASGGGEDKRLKKNTESAIIYCKNRLLLSMEKPIEYVPISRFIQEHKINKIGFYYTRILENFGTKTLITTIGDMNIYEHTGYKFSTISEKMKKENISVDEVYARYYDCIFMVTNAQTSLLTKVNSVTPHEQMLISYEYIPKTGKDKNKLVSKFVWNKTLVVWFADSSIKNDDGVYKEQDIGTLWDDISWGRLDLQGDVPFKNGKKPLKLLDRMLCMATKQDSLILDFFSGSATTAHAVMQLNAEDGGNRKFIMVQLPEPTAENSEAAKAGYKNICEIGKERIRRASEKIKAEAGDKAAGLDIGFLDSSNLQKWNPQPEDLMLSLQAATNNFLPGRSEIDAVYEILLKMGLDLAMPIEERQASGEMVYIIGGGALMICLGEHITLPVAEEIAKLHREYDSELWQVVFRDTGFASDMDKTNIKETLKTAGLDEDSFVCV